VPQRLKPTVNGRIGVLFCLFLINESFDVLRFEARAALKSRACQTRRSRSGGETSRA